MTPIWTSKDAYSNMILHDDWIIKSNSGLGAVQFGYREFMNGKYRLSVRRQIFLFRDRLGLKRTRWYPTVSDYDTHEELCKRLRGFLRLSVEYWNRVIDEFIQKEKEEKEQHLREKYCGFDPEKSIDY